MDDISFQNGLVCGLTLKGLKGGIKYEPIISQDDHPYVIWRFGIDFKAPVNPITLEMFNESIFILHNDGRKIPNAISFAHYPTEFFDEVWVVEFENAFTVPGYQIIIHKSDDSTLTFATGQPIPFFAMYMHFNTYI